MTTTDETLRARREGRTAEIGAANPYDGDTTPVLARVWRAGYREMLADRLRTSPARQQYLAGKPPTE